MKHHLIGSDAVKKINLVDVQSALAPFEEVLLAQLPSKEQVLARARQRKAKQKMRSTALLLCITSGAILYWLDPVYKTEHLCTQLGQIQQLQLSEGSQIQLNSNTQLEVKYALRSKRINLKQGEATFYVKHFARHWMKPLERRFMVYSGQLQVEDIGTVFNVRQYQADHHEVTVLQGHVRVSLHNQAKQQPINLYSQQQIVHQGQQLLLQLNPNVDAHLAWQSGYLQLNGMPLSAVIKELQRYQSLAVQFNDAQSAQMRISGRFKVDHAEQFMQILPQLAQVKTVKTPIGQWQITAVDMAK